MAGKIDDSDSVLVVGVRLDEPPIAVSLDHDEQRRAERFVFDRDRRRYVAAHTALRVILGRFLGGNPADEPWPLRGLVYTCQEQRAKPVSRLPIRALRRRQAYGSSVEANRDRARRSSRLKA